MGKAAVAIFLKAPVPGRVKTRLARTIGDTAACELYRAMVEDLLSAATSCGAPFYLFHDSPRETPLPESWGRSPAQGVVRQVGETLGDRMCAAFELLYAAGHERVIVVGSDIPGIDSTVLSTALGALLCHEAAIVPAVDGGYCLIGLSKGGYTATLFQDISWSTGSVLESTILKMREGHLRLHLLDRRRDIDTLEDLMAYSDHPAAGAAETNRWVAAWQRR